MDLSNAQKLQVREWMVKELRYWIRNYMDTGEINCTLLAECCAEALNLYEDEIDFVIPEEIFDMAVDVEEKFKIVRE